MVGKAMWKGKLRQPCDMKAYHVFQEQESEVALHFVWGY